VLKCVADRHKGWDGCSSRHGTPM